MELYAYEKIMEKLNEIQNDIEEIKQKDFGDADYSVDDEDIEEQVEPKEKEKKQVKEEKVQEEPEDDDEDIEDDLELE